MILNQKICNFNENLAIILVVKIFANDLSHLHSQFISIVLMLNLCWSFFIIDTIVDAIEYIFAFMCRHMLKYHLEV